MISISKIPVGHWIQEGIEILTSRFETQFRATSDSIGTGLGEFIQVLAGIHPMVVILGICFFVFLANRSWKGLVLTFLSLLFIHNLGYWKETLETLTLVVASTLVAAAVGIPGGILFARYRWVYRFFSPALDFMQTIPTFVYLIPTLMLFGLGIAPGIISTVIFAMPACIRMTQLGISQVPKSMIESADAFGATSFQKLIFVELPYAMPTIRAGISQCLMLSLSMVVIAAMVGADGLGKPVIQALSTVNIAKGFEAGIAIVMVAVLLNQFVLEKGLEKRS